MIGTEYQLLYQDKQYLQVSEMIQIIRELNYINRFALHSQQQILFLMQSQSPKLYDWQIFQHVAPYLQISDLLKTSTLSKQYNYTLRNYFRKHFLTKESLQGGQNQLHIMKKMYHRQIKIYKLSDGQSFIRSPNLILKDIQLGNQHVFVETYQGTKHFMEIDQIIKNKFNLHGRYHERFTTFIGDSLFTVNDTKISKILIKKSSEQFQVLTGQIDLGAQILALKQSQTHIFAVTKNTFYENKLFAIHIKEFKSVEVQYEQTKNQTKQIDIDNLSVGANIAYYIKNHKVYELDVETSKEPKLMKSLKDKQITRIINGAKHFFALQKGRKITSEWDTKDLILWAMKQGYEDYVKIFKSQKVTGQTLLKMDKKYMEDVLGIINVKVQQRLMVQLEQFNVESEENCTIYGWGRNDKSQLGLNPSNPVSNPHKITLPQGFKFFKCYNNQTFIYNKKTGQLSMNTAHEGKLVWQPIFEHVYNIWALSVSRDYVAILCPVEKDHVSQHLSEVPLHHKKEKLRTAKNIVDKIQWDEHVDKQQFRVGYLDKFTGILEISFDELLQSSEIKDYRIEYFKRRGQIVWSKKDRIDIL